MIKNNYFILSTALFMMFFVACGKGNNQGSQRESQALPVQVAAVPQKDVITYVKYPTTIEGTISSEVRAKVSGYIQKVLVDEGEKVTKGQALFKLETQSLSQDAEAAKANMNAAKVEVDKLIPLVEKNIISPVQLETAKAKLAQAKSNYKSIVANIGYATVTSPVNGYVGAISYREGALVSASSVKPLTTVASMNQVYAFFSMNETAYLDFLLNTEGETRHDKILNFPKVSLQLANGQMYNLKGAIQTVTGQVDQTTGAVSFRAMFENPNLILANGSSGSIEIPTTYHKVYVVPQSATYEQQGQTFVYMLNSDNTVSSKLITVKDRTNTLYIVESGISAGDKIVVSGIGKLRNKMPIIPNEVAFDSVVEPIKPLFQ
ncbi:efflux RND transporter periplasmic adaptor subunit [Gaetbulibacter saemankumensis]|uniref:efflux RND transporter periplasmic adaptor subunit n=1 Tax=Gaetbulibacter saemankumensis TaxID=311208 RepID=UPI0005513A73|nr:efflux RND transporter periplasmic adaptor subunit [Gaetbulibacter saemankumensis]